MKILAIIGALACGAVALTTNREAHQLSNPEHELFWCCDRKGGEKCGILWTSCCQKGKCTTSAVAAKYCPDEFQLNC